MERWLVKEEPSHYSFEQLQIDGSTVWDGVRNSQAISFLRKMSKGDGVLYYHTGNEKSVVGIANVLSNNPSLEYPQVKIVPERALKRAVSLQEIRDSHRFGSHPLIRQPRLSVMPVPLELWEFVLERERS